MTREEINEYVKNCPYSSKTIDSLQTCSLEWHYRKICPTKDCFCAERFGLKETKQMIEKKMDMSVQKLLMPANQPRKNIGEKWCVDCTETDADGNRQIAFYCPSCQTRALYPAHYCQHCGNYNGGM